MSEEISLREAEYVRLITICKLIRIRKKAIAAREVSLCLGHECDCRRAIDSIVDVAEADYDHLREVGKYYNTLELKTIDTQAGQIAQLTRERDAALAEVERLQGDVSDLTQAWEVIFAGRKINGMTYIEAATALTTQLADTTRQLEEAKDSASYGRFVQMTLEAGRLKEQLLASDAHRAKLEVLLKQTASELRPGLLRGAAWQEVTKLTKVVDKALTQSPAVALEEFAERVWKEGAIAGCDHMSIPLEDDVAHELWLASHTRKQLRQKEGA